MSVEDNYLCCIELNLPEKTYNSMKQQEVYQPISCNFYDHLEATATMRKRVIIHYLDTSGKETSILAKIKDLFVKEKVEYMVLDNGLTIRLDHILDVDGEQLAAYC
jgi:Rho-binding antiterminator